MIVKPHVCQIVSLQRSNLADYGREQQLMAKCGRRSSTRTSLADRVWGSSPRGQAFKQSGEVKFPEQKTQLNLMRALISINQHSSALISFNQNRSAPISIKYDQSASVGINQQINQHQSKFGIDLATIYTNINGPNFLGAWGGYREILRSVRRLCKKVVRGRLQELLSELTIHL